MAIFKKLLACAAVGAVLGLSPMSASAGEQDNVLVEMFKWWNGAFKDENGFTREAFGRYFTDDGAIMINGRVSVKGLDDLVKHFRRIQSEVDYVELVVPFEKEFESASGDEIFTYHYILSRDEGKEELTHAAGWADIENGKIKLIHLIRSEEPNPEKFGY